MKILGIRDSELHSSGAIHTAREIQQQPEVWSSVYNVVFGKKEALLQYMIDKESKVDRIILTGAGTSAFIGMSLACDFEHQWDIPTQAIATTDLVTHPKNYFNKYECILLVSFARSGNSPESCAAVDLAEQFAGRAFHLVITCNPMGNLAKEVDGISKFTVVLPNETNDRSLAMTSSYTGMQLAGLLISRIRSIYDQSSQVLTMIAGGQRILDEYVPQLKEVAKLDFKRAVFLGSGLQLGTATESQLKLQELTDGHVICKIDSYLGFRHGPKAVTDSTTLVFYLFSNVPYALQYETDLVKSMKTGHKPMYQIGIVESPEIEKAFEGDLDLTVRLSDEALFLDEEYLAICNVLPAQLLGFFKSLDLGLTPDNPSKSGAISRVVEGVIIYPYE